jgi:hypothetical protein
VVSTAFSDTGRVSTARKIATKQDENANSNGYLNLAGESERCAALSLPTDGPVALENRRFARVSTDQSKGHLTAGKLEATVTLPMGKVNPLAVLDNAY